MNDSTASMCLAIHNGEGWNRKWREYCQQEHIPFTAVDCYDPGVIETLREFDGLMWHFGHGLPEDVFLARHVLYSAAEMGLKVFPDFHTCWHYDDKVAQKYLFDATGVPAVPAWVFCREDRAFQWLNTAELPLVGKLRRGAGSYNVKLLRTHGEATRYVKRMFSRGYSPAPRLLADAHNKLRVAAAAGGFRGVWDRLKKAPRFFRVHSHGRKYFPREKGYVYLQKFIPGNQDDLRITVVGNRAWAFRRKVRKNDFRASGSGTIEYDAQNVPLDVVRQSFDAAGRLSAQSIAFDWLRDEPGRHQVVEISYCYEGKAVYNAQGYWDHELNWHEGHFWPEHAILDDFRKTLQQPRNAVACDTHRKARDIMAKRASE